MNNADRAENARRAYEPTWYRKENNDEITNLYDFVCDLLHYADTIDDDRREEHGETNGSFVAFMALEHYYAELQEEAEENAQG